MKKSIYALFFLCLFSFHLPAQQFSHPDGDVQIVQPSMTAMAPSLSISGDLVNISAGDVVEGDYISEIRFTPDGNEVWVLHRTTNNISVFDWNSQQIVHNIQVGSGPVDIAFGDSLALVACHFEDAVYVIRMEDYKIVKTIPTSVKPAKIKISRDGTVAVVGCDEEDVAEVLDMATLDKTLSINDFTVFISKFSFITSNPRNSVYWSNFEITPDNQYVVNAAHADELRFFNLSTGAIDYRIPESGNCSQIVLSGDGQKIIATRAANPGLVSQIDIPTFSLENQVEIDGRNLSSMYSAPGVNWDGSKTFVPVLPDNTALVDFNGGTYKLIATGNTPDWVGQSADYRYALASDYYNAVIEFETGNIMGRSEGISIQNGAISTAQNRMVATDPLREESLLFYEFENPSSLRLLNKKATGSELEGDATYFVKFTPDGSRILAVNCLSGTLSVLDALQGTLEKIIPLGSGETFQVDVTSDNRYALVAKRLEDKVSIIDLQSLEVVAEVPSGGSKPDQVFVVPGDQIAYALNAGSSDAVGVIRINGANSQLITSFQVGNTGVSWTNYGIRSDLVFDNESKYALLANPFDNRIQFLDINTQSVRYNVDVPGFPLQIAISDETDFGTFSAVILKNDNAIGLIGGTGTDAALIGTYPCGANPTRIAYNKVAQQFAVSSSTDRKVETFDLNSLSFIQTQRFGDHTPIAVKFNDASVRFTLLRSEDTDAKPHQLDIDGVRYDLPSLPIHHFDVSKSGTQVAIPLPVTDEVVLFTDATLGWQQKVINLNQTYRIAPNPAEAEIRFQAAGEVHFSGPVRIRLFNTSGTLVFDQLFSEHENPLIPRQAAWQAGTYFYEVLKGNISIQSGKFMLK